MVMNRRKVGIAYCFIVVIALIAIGRIIELQFIHRPEPTRKTTRNERIECTRGSILSDDGRYLAFSIPEYLLTIDPCQAVDTLYEANIDSLAIYLARFYKDKSASYYKRLLDQNRNQGKRYLRVNKRLLTYQQMKEVSSFPILRNGRLGGGCVFEKVDHRNYPYGRLGFRTLGYIQHQDSIPKIGLEGSCDSILRGVHGSQPLRLSEGNRWIEDSEKDIIPPKDGLDIQTTIDIDIQDITQNALEELLKGKDGIQAATAIVMEVSSGEIKAMVNLEKTKKGGYDETYNYAIGRKGEPGSVFKAATLTMLLENKHISLNTEIPAVVNWQYGKGKPFTDNYLRSYSSISIKRGFEISSNNVFRMEAVKYYGDRPQEFLDNLTNKLMITKDFPLELRGFAHANLKSVSSKSWNMKDLPQIAMGYTVEITPLHTLNFYNAIANDGVMMKPHLVRNYQKDGVIIQEFKNEKLGEVCSKETAREVKKAMRGVVESVGGTGYKLLHDSPVSIAGKTGTARVVFPGTGKYEDKNGRMMYQATFIGFFPYEAPRYSMIIVAYSEPAHHALYGAAACPAFGTIARKIYAKSTDWNEGIKAKGSLPKKDRYSKLDLRDSLERGVIPNVVGLGLRDAMSNLESNGFSVSYEGGGRVASQNPNAGDSLRSRNIHLILSQE